ncbi:hypothetical protein [Myceligenerans halotolerans]
MISPGTGALRALRILLLAVVTVGLSLVSHLLAGGAHPGTVPLAVLTALTALAIRPLTRREIAMPRLIGVLGAGQVVLHVAFERSAALSAVPGPAHHHQDTATTPWMIGAHAAATLVIAVALRHGEALLWRLWAWLTGHSLPGEPRVVLVTTPPAHGYLPEVRPAFAGGPPRGRAPPVAV